MNNNGQVSEVLGTEAPGQKVPTLKEVQTFLKKDLGMAISLLDAIYRDTNTMNNLAEFLYGRYLNAKEQEAIKNQTKLDI